jgi:hypothetical protein
MEAEDIPGSLGRTLVYRSAGRTLLLILGGLVLIASTALMVVRAVLALPDPVAVLLLLIGGAGLLLFVPGVGRLVWQLGQRRPVLDIGPDGVRDRRLSPEVLPWSAVRGVGRTRVRRQEFVTLDLVPGAEQGYLTGRTNRLMYRVNQRAGFRGLHLNVVGLRCTADELYEAVYRHRR